MLPTHRLSTHSIILKQSQEHDASRTLLDSSFASIRGLQIERLPSATFDSMPVSFGLKPKWKVCSLDLCYLPGDNQPRGVD